LLVSSAVCAALATPPSPPINRPPAGAARKAAYKAAWARRPRRPGMGCEQLIDDAAGTPARLRNRLGPDQGRRLGDKMESAEQDYLNMERLHRSQLKNRYLPADAAA